MERKEIAVPLADDAIFTARGIAWIYPINPQV
jgi:hypothetical protein